MKSLLAAAALVTTITSPALAANNALLLDYSTSTGNLALATPTSVSDVMVFASTGSGSLNFNFTLNFADNSTQGGSFTADDWFYNSNAAIITDGRVSATVPGNYDAVYSGNPRIYQIDLGATPTVSSLKSVSFTVAGGGGHTAIWGLSGVTGTGPAAFQVSGFNQQMVAGGGLMPTASMDDGTGLGGWTWYAYGTNASAPTTGLKFGLQTSLVDGVTPVLISGAVPEPATWALMIAGFGLVGVAARRHKAAVAA